MGSNFAIVVNENNKKERKGMGWIDAALLLFTPFHFTISILCSVHGVPPTSTFNVMFKRYKPNMSTMDVTSSARKKMELFHFSKKTC